MNPPSQNARNSRSSLINHIRTRWLNIRRKRFWALSVLLVYTLLGFFVAPLIIENSIMGLLNEDLARTARLEKVEVNPFVLAIRLQGFEAQDKDNERLAAFDEIYINFQLSSLFHQAWTFSEIRLTQPYFLIERFNESDSRLNRILADFAHSRSGETETVRDSGATDKMPSLLIHDLNLLRGRIDLKDNLPLTTVETRLAPINISIQNLNTLPDRHGKQSVTIQLPENATLQWNGSLTLAPLDSQGELVLENLHLDPALPYLQSKLPLESITATLSTRFKYRVHMAVGGQPDIDVTDISMKLDNIGITGLTPPTEFLKIPGVLMSGGVLRYPEQTLKFASLEINEPLLLAWRKKNGIVSLADLVPKAEKDADVNAPTAGDFAWQFGIDKISLANGALQISDTSVEPVAVVDVENLMVSLSGLSSEDGTQMPLDLEGALQQGGSFRLDGALGLMPDISLSGNISTRDLPMTLGQPYLQQFAHLQIQNGSLNSDIEMTFAQGQNFTATGEVQIPALEIEGTLDQQKLLSWHMLDIDRFDFDLKANRLHLSQLTFDRSFGRFEIDENKVTNLSKLIIEPAGNGSGSASIPMDFIIGGILVKDSEMDFSDLSLPLPFATHIANLDGSISTIDTGSEAPANIKLEGQVDEYGLARINGGINVLDPIRHTDITVEFSNLLMSNLSPYTVQFAGREIDEGKLDLSLEYSIKEGLLNGSNAVVLSDLELGRKVDHPGASSLPLGLAVGLLKDADGVIKIDLPVEGDINNPEFQIGGVVWQAISSMITKIVSAPFRLLGKLIGIDSEDLGQFEFLAGRADLTPPELEKIVQLEEALLQRPELIMEISGVMDRSLDVAALKRIKLIADATHRIGEESGSRDDQTMMLDDEIRTTVEIMFVERFPDIELSNLKAQYSTPPASDSEGAAVLDELAFATDLWNQLLASEPVSDQDLMELAQSRAQVIRNAFLANGNIGDSRLVIAEPKVVESEDDEWVILELSIVSN